MKSSIHFAKKSFLQHNYLLMERLKAPSHVNLECLQTVTRQLLSHLNNQNLPFPKQKEKKHVSLPLWCKVSQHNMNTFHKQHKISLDCFAFKWSIHMGHFTSLGYEWGRILQSVRTDIIRAKYSICSHKPRFSQPSFAYVLRPSRDD